MQDDEQSEDLQVTLQKVIDLINREAERNPEEPEGAERSPKVSGEVERSPEVSGEVERS